MAEILLIRRKTLYNQSIKQAHFFITQTSTDAYLSLSSHWVDLKWKMSTLNSVASSSVKRKVCIWIMPVRVILPLNFLMSNQQKNMKTLPLVQNYTKGLP